MDINVEHIKLFYHKPDSDGGEISICSALISPPVDYVFRIQFLTKNKKILQRILEEIDFYLLQKKEPNPWEYAKYHCHTASNLYSNVLWSYHMAKVAKNNSPKRGC